MNPIRILLLLLLFLASCQPTPPPPAGGGVEVTPETALVVASWEEIAPTLAADKDLDTWLSALAESAAFYNKRPAKAEYLFGPKKTTAGRLATLLSQAVVTGRKQGRPALESYLKEHFTPYRSVGRDGQGEILVTGYYEPLLQGSLTPDKRFRFPIYRTPEDLVEVKLDAFSQTCQAKSLQGRVEGGKLLPYYDRKEIDGDGKLAGKKLELVWVDDQVDLFFLHIQGSGRVLLPTGKWLRVGYDRANGRPYRSIGQLLIEEKHLPKEEVNLPNIKKWLAEHPKEQERVLNYNPSYVFFRKMEGTVGPLGNIAVPLTPFRSIATDASLFPKGAPGLLTTELPVFQDKGPPVRWEKRGFLVVNQDTGGAIKGPGRVDLFTGFGPHAESTAGYMKQLGKLYFLVPNDP